MNNETGDYRSSTLQGTEQQCRDPARNALAARLNEMQTSAAWRLAKPIRWLDRRFPRATRGLALLSELVPAALSGKLIRHLHLRRDIRSIYASGFFNADWYVQRYPEVAIAGLDPAVHYLTDGARDGYWPSPYSDPIAQSVACSDSPKSTAQSLLDYSPGGYSSAKSTRAVDMVAPVPSFFRTKILESGLFDADWYLASYPDVRECHPDPLFHYLTRGWREGLAPSSRFNGQIYLRCHPDVRAAGLNPLTHFVLYGDPADPCNEPFTNCGSARQAVATMMEKIGCLDPQLQATEYIRTANVLPCYDGHATGGLFALWERMFSALDRAYDRIVCVPRLIRDGSDLVAVQAVRAAIERHGPEGVLLLVTDFERADACGHLPAGAAVLVVSDYAQHLGSDDRASIVEILIQALKPKAVFNVDSRACWEAIRRRGKALATFCDIYVALSGWSDTADGSPAGYANLYFRDCFESLRKVYSDNARFVQELVERYGVPPSLLARIAVVRQPVRDGLESRGFSLAKPGVPLRVLVAAPFHRQNDLAFLGEIAVLAVDVRFDVYGDADDPRAQTSRAPARRSDRVRFMGPYCSIEAIPTADYGAFLFASLAEGLPNAILDAAALGVPIVASDVGGIRELIDDDTGWLIRDCQDPQCFADALQQIRLGGEESQRRVANLLQRVAALHSRLTYLEAFSASPSFLD